MWNSEETCEVRKFENAIWEPHFDTMGRWKDRKKKCFCFNGVHCLTYLNQSEQADYCRSNWWHKKLSLFSTLSYIPCQLIRYVLLKIFMQAKEFVDIDCLKIGHYVAAVYEGQWCPSLMFEISWDQRDLLVKSIHNSAYDKNCFFWPPRDDTYYMPFSHIIGLTEVPNISGRHGQNCYKISAKLLELFNQNLSKLLNRKQ